MLYNNILSRIQKCMPERQELLKPPLYVILSQDRELPRGIQLSPRSSTHPSNSSSLQTNIPFDPTPSNSQILGLNSDTVGQVHIPEALLSNTLSSLVGFSPKASTENLLYGHPRLNLNIWLQKSMPLVDFPVEVFGDWLRMMPILAQRVQIDTGTISIFTSLELRHSKLIRLASLTQATLNAVTTIIEVRQRQMRWEELEDKTAKLKTERDHWKNIALRRTGRLRSSMKLANKERKPPGVQKSSAKALPKNSMHNSRLRRSLRFNSSLGS
jgi:hypothetical protein